MKKDRMSRSLRICVWMMVIALFLAGCGTTDSAPPKETASQVPDVTEQLIQMQTEPIPTEAAPTEPVLTEIIDNGNRPGEDDGFVHSHPLGTTVSYDLNGDGLDEDITVQAQEYGAGLLMIGNTSLEFEAISPAGYFTVVNIDQSQRILLVGISDYGFSDDDMTVLYAYDGAEIAEVGFFGDILGENSYNRNGATCHGDGTISARVRMDILGTWNACGLYRLGEAGLEDHTDLYQYAGWDGSTTGWEVTTKMELTMYTDSEQTAERVTVPAETVVRMTAAQKGQLENTHWVCFEVDSLDAELWLLTEEIKWTTFVSNGEELLDSEEVFSGFGYAR